VSTTVDRVPRTSWPTERWPTLRAAIVIAVVSSAALVACSSDDDRPEPTVTTTDRPSGTTTAVPDTTVVRVPALSAESTVSTVGLDDVFFGMTLDEAQNAAGYDFTVVGSSSSPCFTATPDGGPEGVSFTFVDGRVERVDVTGGPISTRSGARVGSTAADVQALYGDRIELRPRNDGQPGGLLVFVPADAEDAQFRLVFVTDGATITAFRAGRLPVIERDQSC
jgi:hypothetical protein